MSTFHKGQRVKVEFEAFVVDPAPDAYGEVRVRVEGDCLDVPAPAVSAIDDPSSDPIGAVRLVGTDPFVRAQVMRNGSAYVLGWRSPFGCNEMADRQMVGHAVIGAMPGTPAFAVYGHMNGGAS